MTKKEDLIKTLRRCRKEKKKIHIETLVSMNYIGIDVRAHHIEKYTHDVDEIDELIIFYKLFDDDLVYEYGRGRYEVRRYRAID